MANSLLRHQLEPFRANRQHVVCNENASLIGPPLFSTERCVCVTSNSVSAFGYAKPVPDFLEDRMLMVCLCHMISLPLCKVHLGLPIHWIKNPAHLQLSTSKAITPFIYTFRAHHLLALTQNGFLPALGDTVIQNKTIWIKDFVSFIV